MCLHSFLSYSFLISKIANVSECNSHKQKLFGVFNKFESRKFLRMAILED